MLTTDQKSENMLCELDFRAKIINSSIFIKAKI